MNGIDAFMEGTPEDSFVPFCHVRIKKEGFSYEIGLHQAVNLVPWSQTSQPLACEESLLFISRPSTVSITSTPVG